MTGYIIRRLGQAVVVTFGVTIATFLLLHLIPSGTLARQIVGPRAPQQTVDQFVKQYGLNENIFVQYWKWLGRLLHGNLGYSYHLNKSVDLILQQYLGKDLLLGITSLVLATAIAIPIGIAQAVKRNGTLDYAGTGVSFVLYAVPQYLLGAILIIVLVEHQHVISLAGEVHQNAQTVGGMVRHPTNLVLPVLTLTLTIYALFSRYMRSSAIDTLAQDYIRTARAKGLPERRVLTRHLLRNSLITVVTLVGLSIPGILTAGLIVEQVFNYPGIGYLYYQSAISSDFSEMLGITVLVAMATVIGNLLADIGYAILDPRIRY
jgi:peptide/nickel transport system permease protein